MRYRAMLSRTRELNRPDFKSTSMKLLGAISHISVIFIFATVKTSQIYIRLYIEVILC
jgi:hypothetical protein